MLKHPILKSIPLFKSYGCCTSFMMRQMTTLNLAGKELTLEIYPSPCLVAECQPVSEFNDELREFSNKLTQIMKREKAQGIAAPQVGYNIQLVVIDTKESMSIKCDSLVMINPRITKSSKAVVSLEEGCISFPEVFCKIQRPREIVIEAHDVDGKVNVYRLGGRLARAAQHEMDHLKGVSFPDQADPESWKQVMPKLEALEKSYKEKRPDGAFE